MNQHSYLVGLVAPGSEFSVDSALHEREAERHGLRYLCRRVEAAGDFAQLLDRCRDFGFSGLGIAPSAPSPTPQALDELSATAGRTGNITTVVLDEKSGRTTGHDTAVTAFTAAFERGLPGVGLTRVVQLGAGGTGASVAHALADRGVEHLVIVDESIDRASALAEAVNRHTPHRPAEAGPAEALDRHLKQADGLVSTVADTTAQPDPAVTEFLHGALWIYDTDIRYLSSPLLRAGRTLGCPATHGGPLLVHTTAATFHLLTGRTPHTSHMLGDFVDLTADARAHT